MFVPMRTAKVPVRVFGYLWIVGLAVALVSPAAFRPPMLQESFWMDWVWLDQFARQLGSGDPYPRWLFQSHGGLGSPVFYYYPPLAFYVGAAFILAGLTTYAGLLAAFAIGFALSGVGMFLYLREERRPLLGAVVFMAAPYHLVNFYYRGAVAESVATAVIPFVAIGIRRLHEGRGIAGLSVSYALLILAHLPLALLVTAFFAVPLVLQQRDLRKGIIALGLGAGIAAFYLVPALLLAPFRNTEALWNVAHLRPGYWSIWSGDAVTRPIYVLTASAAGAVLLAALAVRSRWAVYAGACAILAVGVIPFVWNLPLLRDVQFPFRILPIAEFAIAVAVARANRGAIYSTVALLPLLAVSFLIVRAPTKKAAPVTWAELATVFPDAPENLPPGAGPVLWPSRWALELARSSPHGSVFRFPAWEVRCSGKVITPNSLVLRPMSGCIRRLVMTKAEILGWLVSLISALALFVQLRRPSPDRDRAAKAGPLAPENEK